MSSQIDVRITLDERNNNNRRVHMGGTQICKVYGWNPEDVETKAQMIANALKGIAAQAARIGELREALRGVLDEAGTLIVMAVREPSDEDRLGGWKKAITAARNAFSSAHPPQGDRVSPLADELEGVISDLESSGWARAPQCIRTLRRVAGTLHRAAPPLPADVERLVKALEPLLKRFDAYREGDCSQASAHDLLVRYPLWDEARAALASFAGREEISLNPNPDNGLSPESGSEEIGLDAFADRVGGEG